MANTTHFSAADYVVFTLVLIVSAAIGLFYGFRGGGQKTTKDFLMGGRSMSVFPVSLSLLASFMSAITLLGTPAEIYTYGTQYWLIWVGYCIMIPLVCLVFVPVFYRLGITSVFEYLEMRFGRAIRLSCVISYIIQMVLYMAIVLYAPSLALNAVTGFNVWASVFSVGVVCTFYTTIGGIKAVVWTDAFQMIIMFAGFIAILTKGFIDHGGFAEVWRDLGEGQRLEFFNFDPNPTTRHTVWNLVIGGQFTWLSIYAVNQAQVQRALSVPTLKKAQLAMLVNLPGLTALLTICALCGTIVYAEYKDCDPLKAGRISAADQLLPRYVMDSLAGYPGLPGLFTASLFSGALSTISSGLNSLAAVMLQDIIKPLFFPKLPDQKATIISKIIATVFGALCIALTFVAAQLGGVLQAALGLFGMIGGPQLGVYCLGIMYPSANHKGALVGFFTSLVFSIWLGIGAQVYKPYAWKAPVSVAGCNLTEFGMTSIMSNQTSLESVYAYRERSGFLSFYEISYMWFGALSVGVVVFVGLIVSYITGPLKAGDVHPDLLCPIFDKFCCCLPEKILSKLRCNVDYSKKSTAESNSKENLDQDGDFGVYQDKKSQAAYVNYAADKSMDSIQPQIYAIYRESNV